MKIKDIKLNKVYVPYRRWHQPLSYDVDDFPLFGSSEERPFLVCSTRSDLPFPVRLTQMHCCLFTIPCMNDFKNVTCKYVCMYVCFLKSC